MIATMFFAKLAQPPDGTDDELIIGVPAAQELRGDPLSPPALVRLLACRASGVNRQDNQEPPDGGG